MEEKLLVKKSTKAENLYMVSTLITGLIHLTIFAISAYNIFMPNGDKNMGIYLGLIGGVIALILFAVSCCFYIKIRSQPETLIEEKEEGFSILSGKEYCRFEYIEDVYSKPFLKKNKESNFGKIVLCFPSGEIYKIKNVENVLATERKIKEILNKKGAEAKALED